MKIKYILLVILVILVFLVFSCSEKSTKRNSVDNVIYHYTQVLDIIEKNINSTSKGIDEVKTYLNSNYQELKTVAQDLVDEKDEDLVVQAISKIMPIYVRFADLQKKNNDIFTHPDVIKTFSLIDPTKMQK